MPRARRLDRPQSDWVKQARRQGWRVEPGKDGVKLYPADRTKSCMSIHSSPKRNGHAHKNMVRDLRNAGLEV